MHHTFLATTMLPFPWSYFCVPPNTNAHPTSRFPKLVRQNPTTPTPNQSKWKSVGFTDGPYVVEIIKIPYPGFGVITDIISKKDTSYWITIGNIPSAHARTSPKCPIKLWVRKGNERLNTFTLCSNLYVRWTTTTNIFIHVPTYTYNEVMHKCFGSLS